jgi:molybdenum-dependent DNA-binding transcriptional regulator ModE
MKFLRELALSFLEKQIQTIHPPFIFVLYTRSNLLEEKTQMRKQIVALLAAVLITGSIAMSMLVVGANAMTNQNGTPVSNSASVAAAGSTTALSDQAQIAQLQAQVAQYQAREQEYQAALQSDNDQLTKAASQLQMIQQLLAYLQSHGLIQIDNQGQIYVTGH